ncbi:MAG: AI-2E family transporter [Desulfobacteraceae bacterium]|nr:AI-2E family transporter [Desulfobacteraceae bacterium]
MEAISIRNGSLMGCAAFIIIVAGMKAAAVLVVPFLLAVFLAIICGPPLFWMQKKGIPNIVAIFILLLGAIGVQVLLVTLVSSSISDFSDNLPFYQDRLITLTHEGLGILSRYGINVGGHKLAQIFNPSYFFKLAANMLNGLGGVLTNTFFVFLTFIFMLSEASGFPNKLRALAGGSDTDLERYSKITSGVNRYLGIKTLTCLTTGVVIALWLMVQGVDFPIMWGVLAFLLNYIPNIGSIIAAVPAVLLALVQLGPGSAAVAGLGFLIVNTVVGSIIEPRVMGQGIGLSALVVFLSMAFWGWVLGPVGMLLSVPLTMAAKIALGGHSSTRWLAVLLGSNKEAAIILEEKDREPKALV